MYKKCISRFGFETRFGKYFFGTRKIGNRATRACNPYCTWLSSIRNKAALSSMRLILLDLIIPKVEWDLSISESFKPIERNLIGVAKTSWSYRPIWHDSILTFNGEDDALADWRRYPILSNAQIGSHLSAGNPDEIQHLSVHLPLFCKGIEMSDKWQKKTS